jgi:hypothetical protein
MILDQHVQYPSFGSAITFFSMSWNHQELLLLAVCISEDLDRHRQYIFSYHLRQTHTFPAHQRPVSGPFSTFPESAARLTDKDCFADATGFGFVNLFSGAEATVILLVYCLLSSHRRERLTYQIMRLACSLG